ncbi:class I SAM-dependent methyltransferase [Haloarchaeobius litoreus]|uniref:Class I SAM-dependent methyltransferase n=1 Tax=Haloarchaeobius litoreus TaxID=755306 RepID=A0ABD6DJV6_9EURY|nr:class I SAM-dependent methyltransferase [Haloarchaeobius litoreus]
MSTDEHQATGGTVVQRNEEVYRETAMVDRYDSFGEDGWLTDREAAIVDEHFAEPGRVLDVGCGTGRTSRPLAERGHDVVGIDVSDEMVAQARARHPDLTFAVDDVTDLDFADETFDYVLFSYYGLDSIYPESGREQAMRELHRLLKPGGVFTFNSHNWWYVLPALLTDAGFDHVTVVGKRGWPLVNFEISHYYVAERS